MAFKKEKRDTFALGDYVRLSQLLLSNETPFAAKEAYKSIRTHLLYISPGEGCKRIAFTSANEHEGKSLTCVNLAVSMAQTGKRVLIVDADLRKPMLTNVFGFREIQGLSEHLAGISGIADMGRLSPAKTKYENLAVLPAGHIPPNPAELLSSPRLHEIFDAMDEYYDFIFIDTPPIGAVTDTALLIPEVHGHIFVVRAESTKIEYLRSAVYTMSQLGANILGFILNDYDPKRSKNYTGKHYNKHSLSGYYYDKNKEYHYGEYSVK